MPATMSTYQAKPILKKSSSEGSGSLSLKKVWFDSVEIKYHKIILGDNPAVSEGAPITISWKPLDREVVDVDCYESSRIKTKKVTVLKMAVQDRAAILLQNGYTIEDLAAMTQEVHEVQRKRAQSSENQKWDRFNEFAESSGKIFRKLARLNLGSPATRRNSTNPAA
eukprot:Nitzschia sp. Nitz4//scaffold280_size24494//19940//20440//NITZ4_008395-RA/size24494-processed-gene-0.22-mRNA-1//1//CDS//3329545600//237//frame0